MTDVTYNGFAWSLSETVTPVLDALGEPCVVGPVTLTAKSPAMIGTGAASRHGSMVNPVSLTAQGYDGRMSTSTTTMGYDAALNVDTSLPLSLPSGSSLCSMESGNLAMDNLEVGGNPGMLERFGVLSVMPSVPAAGTFFRPPFTGTSKPVYLTSQVRTDLLPNLAMPFDPVGDQTDNVDYKIDSPQWGGLPSYQLIMRQERPANRMAPRYQMSPYPATEGRLVGQVALLAASNHPRRVEMLYRLIRRGIDAAHIIMDTGKDAVFLAGAGYGIGGNFLAIAVAARYLDKPEWFEMLSKPWEPSHGNWSYGPVDATNTKVNAFWETTTLYSSPKAWSGYALPRPRSEYPYGPALYGEPRATLVIGGNDCARDPNLVYHGVNAEGILYAHGLTSAMGYTNYYRVAVPAFVVQMMAAKFLGVSQHYPGAAHDLFYQHISDYKMWNSVDLRSDAYQRDAYAFGGTGNGFAEQMWQAHGFVEYNDDPQSPHPAPRKNTTLNLRIKAP